MKFAIVFLTLFYPFLVIGQTNCLAYQDSAHRKACELYQMATDHAQGSRISQSYFLESLKACPTFAPSLYEMSVPYLKRGDFYTWKLLIDKAVKINPQFYLPSRGSDLFFFLRDYKGALKDIERSYILNKGQPGYSVNGDYDLRIVMALCLAKIGNIKRALEVYDECLTDHVKTDNIGLYDYLHRGVMYFRLRRYEDALADLNKQTDKYTKLADTYYYIGLVYLKLNNKSFALSNLLKAEQLFTKTGYHRFDSYNEEPDQVFLSDITEKLKSLTSYR